MTAAGDTELLTWEKLLSLFFQMDLPDLPKVLDA